LQKIFYIVLVFKNFKNHASCLKNEETYARTFNLFIIVIGKTMQDQNSGAGC